MPHTPGPWTIQQCGDDFWIDVPAPAPMHRRDICRLSFNNPDNNSNSRLIGSAPDLLDLLTDALPYVEEGEEFNKPGCRHLSKKIRAAIERIAPETFQHAPK
jgi:hypothetical protein